MGTLGGGQALESLTPDTGLRDHSRWNPPTTGPSQARRLSPPKLQHPNDPRCPQIPPWSGPGVQTAAAAPPPEALPAHPLDLSSTSSNDETNWEEELIRQEENLAGQGPAKKGKQSFRHVVRKWVEKAVAVATVAAVVSAPGVICFFLTGLSLSRREIDDATRERGVREDDSPVVLGCYPWHLNLVWWSLLMVVSLAAYLGSVLFTSTLHVIIRSYETFSRILLYYVSNVGFSFRFLVWGIVTYVAWSSMLRDTALLSEKEGVKGSPFARAKLLNEPTNVPAILQRLLLCFIITGGSWLTKDIIVRVIAIHFHRTSYAPRIWQAMFTEYVLGLLMGAPAHKPKSSGVLLSAAAGTLLGHGVALHQQSSLEHEARKQASSADTVDLDKGGEISPNGAAIEVRVDPEKSTSKEGRSTGRRTLASFRARTTGENIIPQVKTTVQITEDEISGRHVSDYRLSQFISFLTENPYYIVHAKVIEEAHNAAKKPHHHAAPNRLPVASRVRRRKPPMDDPLALTTQHPHRSKHGTKPSRIRAQATRSLARRLFYQIKEDKADNIVMEDFEQYIPFDFLEDAFRIFDANHDGSLNYREFVSTVHAISKERKSLSDTLLDAEKAIKKLDHAFLILMFCVLSVVYSLVMFDLAVNQVLLTLSSVLVPLAFALGPTAKALVESVVFLFVAHPFDNGDRILLGPDEVVHTVYRMNLLNTCLRRFDQAQVYYSNTELAKLQIINLRRSPEMIDVIDVNVLYQTPASLLRAFQDRILRYISRMGVHFQPHAEVYFKECTDSNRLLIQIWVHHRHNFADMKRFRQRRSRMVLKIRGLLEDLGISYHLPPQRVSVKLSDEHNHEHLDESTWERSRRCRAAARSEASCPRGQGSRKSPNLRSSMFGCDGDTHGYGLLSSEVQTNPQPRPAPRNPLHMDVREPLLQSDRAPATRPVDRRDNMHPLPPQTDSEGLP